MLHIEVFTDPGLPVRLVGRAAARGGSSGSTATSCRARSRMVVLSESPEDYLAKGFDPPKQAVGMGRIRDQYGHADRRDASGRG